MSFTKTLTATVAALYLGMGSAGAEEPKPQERPLSCSKGWYDLLSKYSVHGLNKPQTLRFELQLDKDSSVRIQGVMDRQEIYAMVVTCVSEKDKQNTPEKLTCFYTSGKHLNQVNVMEGYGSTNEVEGYESKNEIDLSNPKIRQTAERKFCGYVKQAAAKYEKDHRQVKDDKVQKQLELLK